MAYPHTKPRPAITLAGPPPPPPEGPNWDFTSDSPVHISGPGVATVHWGIVIISGTGPYTYDPAAAGSFDVALGNGESQSGLLHASVTDLGTGGSSPGALFWQTISDPV